MTPLELSTEVAIFIFVVTSMLIMGLGLSLSQILEPLRSTRLYSRLYLQILYWC